MIKPLLALITLIALCAPASAQEIICTIANDPAASTLLIEYVHDKPSLLALKSPDENEFRPLDLLVDPVSIGTGIDSFNATPKTTGEIDWSIEQNCFKEIGTQWYFVLNFNSQSYSVFLVPALEVENSMCIPPRFTPQRKILNCQVNG